MNTERSSRQSLCANTKLELSETNPFLRLKQLCKLGRYIYKFSFDKFQNGYMITCSLTSTFKIPRPDNSFFMKKRLVARKTVFSNHELLDDAKNDVCQALLTELNLSGPSSFKIENTGLYNLMVNGAEQCSPIVSQLLDTATKSWADLSQSMGGTCATNENVCTVNKSNTDDSKWETLANDSTTPST